LKCSNYRLGSILTQYLYFVDITETWLMIDQQLVSFAASNRCLPNKQLIVVTTRWTNWGFGSDEGFRDLPTCQLFSHDNVQPYRRRSLEVKAAAGDKLFESVDARMAGKEVEVMNRQSFNPPAGQVATTFPRDAFAFHGPPVPAGRCKT
jgi:hypothetical protein